MPRQVDYYDKNGELIKQQLTVWNNLNGARVWGTSTMYDVRNNASATYHLQNTEVNVGLPDQIFTERQIRRGYSDH